MYDEEFDDDEEVEYYALRPNKTLIKRELAEIADLVKQLVALSPANLEQFNFDEAILQGLKIAASIQKGAQKRQIKYLVGVFKKLDLVPVREKLAQMQSKSAHAVRQHHLQERWRDRLIAGDDADVSELLEKYPEIDRQQLRQLIRSAKKESSQAIPPKYSRMLYQFLKEAFNKEAENLPLENENLSD